MSLLNKEIEKHIKKLVNPLKEDEELISILKVKLTKKEFKLLKAWSINTSLEEIKIKLNLNENSYTKLSSKLIKKLNQEKIKQAICI